MINIYLKTLTAVVASVVAGGWVAPAQAQLLNDTANLKILSARAKILRLNNDYFNDQLKKSGVPTNNEEALDLYRGRVGCGSVDIGNQVVDSGLSTEISVIIVGDVINVGNNCRR